MSHTTRLQAEVLADRVREKFAGLPLTVTVREIPVGSIRVDHQVEVMAGDHGISFTCDALDGGPGALRPEAMVLIRALAEAAIEAPAEPAKARSRRRAAETTSQQHPQATKDDSGSREEEHQDGGETASVTDDDPGR